MSPLCAFDAILLLYCKNVHEAVAAAFAESANPPIGLYVHTYQWEARVLNG